MELSKSKSYPNRRSILRSWFTRKMIWPHWPKYLKILKIQCGTILPALNRPWWWSAEPRLPDLCGLSRLTTRTQICARNLQIIHKPLFSPTLNGTSKQASMWNASVRSWVTLLSRSPWTGMSTLPWTWSGRTCPKWKIFSCRFSLTGQRIPVCLDVLLSNAGPICGISPSKYKSISDVLRVFFPWHLYCTGLGKMVLWLLFLL